MTPAAALADPAATDAPAPARARIERQMDMLARLAEIGMELAETCGQGARAMAAAANDDAPTTPAEQRHNPALVFARVARAVRMTIALEQRLASDLDALDRANTLAEKQRTDARRQRLGRLVDQAARETVDAQRDAGLRRWRDEADFEAEIERVADEAYERLTDAEDGFFEGLSFDAAVAAICNDLGLAPDWPPRLKGAMAAPAPRDAILQASGEAPPAPDGPRQGGRRKPGPPDPTRPPKGPT